jgi:hypothetical protein
LLKQHGKCHMISFCCPANQLLFFHPKVLSFSP